MLPHPSPALLSIALLLILSVAQRCSTKSYADGESSFNDEYGSSNYTRTRAPELRDMKMYEGKADHRRRRAGFTTHSKPVPATKLPEEYHYPYRPKFPAHPLLGFCRLEDFDFSDEDRLGKGGFGEVFRARHVSGKIVALKKTSATSIREKPKHVENEETIQRILMHPNIGRLLCTMRNGQNDIYFALEYFGSGNLAKQLSNLGRLPRSLMVKYIAQILLALRFMHMHCIIYRDLKAENIMLDNNDNIKIIDFGLSVYSCEREQKSLAGTLEYVAPEVARRGEYGREVDYYSLGVLLYLLQMKKLPYRRGKVPKDEFAKQIAKGILKIPPTGDPKVDELLNLLTLPNQEERWKRVYEEFDLVKNLSFFTEVDWGELEEVQDYALQPNQN